MHLPSCRSVYDINLTEHFQCPSKFSVFCNSSKVTYFIKPNTREYLSLTMYLIMWISHEKRFIKLNIRDGMADFSIYIYHRL